MVTESNSNTSCYRLHLFLFYKMGRITYPRYLIGSPQASNEDVKAPLNSTEYKVVFCSAFSGFMLQSRFRQLRLSI